MSLSDANIFHARQILQNFRSKKSTFIDNQRNAIQILCLVSETNEILVHFKRYNDNQHVDGINVDNGVDADATINEKRMSGERKRKHSTSASNWKLIVWFQKNRKSIQDLCFDPNGSQLLVVCYDNTLHIVPILWIIDAEFGLKTTTSQEIENFYWPFRSDEITSFIVPFSGAHDCSNAKTCPNNGPTDDKVVNDERDNGDKYTPLQINEAVLSNSSYHTFYLASNDGNNQPLTPDDASDATSIAEKSPDGCEKSIVPSSNQSTESESKTESKAMSEPCPFPMSVVWWVTSKSEDPNSRQHRAIIGYSDGSICIVALTPNCPFIANTAIEVRSGGVQRMTICRDPILKSVSLLINSTTREQWKLLLEQNSIGYIFPDDLQNCHSSTTNQSQSTSTKETLQATKPKNGEDEWQIIIPVSNESSDSQSEQIANGDADVEIESKDDFVQLNNDAEASTNGIAGIGMSSAGLFPAARARLASLRDLGAKKIGALKLKLIENKIKSNERDRNRQQMTQLACMHLPSFSPEILTTQAGPHFIVQCLKGLHLLSALHPYSDTLSVHSMDISLIPLHIYKIPKDCSDVLITPYVMFAKQMIERPLEQKTTDNGMPKEVENSEILNDEKVNAISVIGCHSTSLKIGEDSEFNETSILGHFPLAEEVIIDIHRVPFQPIDELDDFEATRGIDAVDASGKFFPQPKVTTRNYVTQHQEEHRKRRTSGEGDDHLFDLDDRSVIEHRFPVIELDRCTVVTNRSVYCVEFRDHPHILFLNLVRDGQWKACEDFCKIFELNFGQCVEYSGDVLLKKQKTTQALLTYNVAKVPPVKTALKLAMFGQNSALMHLCAMALKTVHLLRSSSPKNHTIKYLLETNEAMKSIVESKAKTPKRSKNDLNCGVLVSDFSYERDETSGDLQMSNPSQFHLSNLLLLTLTEKAIKDKQYMPLWNFLVSNRRYHTNMSSIVLAQSGLYASSIILALNRGAHMDAYCAMVGVTSQEFGWYSEINDILHNLSDPIFAECIIFLQHISLDYFDCIQSKVDRINATVLERLRHQLDPFSPVFRPVVSQLSSNFVESDSNDINKRLIEFCRHLIETFLVIVIRLFTMSFSAIDNVGNGLSMIYVRHEENQFAIKVKNCAPISVGFSHCAAIVDGCCYLWGSNGINCALSSMANNDPSIESMPRCLEFIASMALEVHAVKCGKAHTLVLTNNGLYAMGSNLYGQLGIGRHHIQALQPMLVPEFDGMNVSLIEVGQYHNAVYADGVLYSWGWGIYGQLGHGNIFIEDRPKAVKFFRNKIVKQFALGHAHTLVLCSEKTAPNKRILYAFGCNLFGQLGTGQLTSEIPHEKIIKSTKPIVIELDEPIVYIHTKFFANYVVTENNKLYTWGASPQLIRLMNQANKRARLARKFEETKTTINEQQTENCERSKANKENSNEANGDSVDARVDNGIDAPVTNIEDRLKSFLKMKTLNKADVFPVSADEARQESKSSVTEAPTNGSVEIEEEITEHMFPSQVDTSEIVGDIVHVSSGLYHSALVTSASRLYTWGKNLEKQLGRESSRCDLAAPSQLELNDNIIYVECGADYTVILTDHFTVKAFGNNNFGQCGRELCVSNDRNSIAGKLVRLRSSKRVVRLPDSSQCIEQPVDVPLPRPKIRMNFDAVRYLKSVPKFRANFIRREFFDESPSDADGNFGGFNNSLDSGSDDVVRQFQELDLNNRKSCEIEAITSNFIHYCLFIFHGIYDPHKILEFAPLNEFKVRILMLNYYVKEAFSVCLASAKATIGDDSDRIDKLRLSNYVIKLFEYFTKDASVVPIHRTDLKYLIHAIFMYFIQNDLPLTPIESYFLSNIDHYLFGLAFVLYFNNNNSKLERQVQQKYTHLFSGCTINDGDAFTDSCTTNGDRETDVSSENESEDLLHANEPETVQKKQQQQQQQQIKTNAEEVNLDFEVIFNSVSTSFKTIICQRLIEFDNELN